MLTNASDTCFHITPAALLVVQYNENFLTWKLIGKKKCEVEFQQKWSVVTLQCNVLYSDKKSQHEAEVGPTEIFVQ